MSAKVDVFMPLFVGDYLADTTDLTTEEHGAYFLLLMNLWKRGGRLPCDPPRLARMAGLSPERWEAVWMTIGRFFDLEDGHLSQARVMRELDRAKARKEAASENGRKSGEARRQRALNGRSNETRTEPPTEPPTDVPTDVPTESNSSSPSPSPEKDQIPPNPPRGGEGVSAKTHARKAEPLEYPAEFETWWAVTNKGGSKAKALEQWKRLGKPPAERLIASWRAWQKTEKWRAGFEPYPVTWLNGRMHEQEPPAGRSAPATQQQPKPGYYKRWETPEWMKSSG